MSARVSGRSRVRTLDIHWLDDGGGMGLVERERVQVALEAALGRRRGCFSVSVLLIDARASDRLHRRHFGVRGATDVMTFPDGGPDAEGRTHLCDLAVCPAVARRAARTLRRRAEDELTLYCLHGLLHCLGYDDTDPVARRCMWRRQAALLRRAGILLDDPG